MKAETCKTGHERRAKNSKRSDVPLGGVDKEVGSSAIGAEAPNLPGVGDVPSVLIGEKTRAELEVVAGGDLAILNGLGNLLVNRLGGHVQPVVLVLGLGEGDHGRRGLDGLPVGDDGVGDLEGDTGVVLDEILEANLEVELSGSGDDVLSGLGDPGLDTRVGLGETLETLNELGEIVGVLDLNCDLDDGGDAETDAGQKSAKASQSVGKSDTYENFMTFMLWAVSEVVRVPFLRRNWSTPTSPTMFPAGQSSRGSTRPPIMRTVRWMDLTKRSSFLPGT